MAKKTEKTRINPLILAALLFIIFYWIMYMLSALMKDSKAFDNIPILNLILPFPSWISPTYYILPAIGFFFIYMIVDWVNDYFKTGQALSPVFPVLFFVIALFAHYIAVSWFSSYIESVTGQNPNFDIWSMLKSSAYYLFVIGGIFGWISRYIVEKAK